MKFNYEKSLVCFIDILGFRELVKSNNTDKIQAYFNISEKVTEFWKNTQSKEKIEFITVSDSVVISLDMPEDLSRDKKIANIREFFIAISILQGELALSDIWSRGGISVGNHCALKAKNIVFGPAMVAAYDLETKVAKYPRVVVDQKLVDFLDCASANEFIHEINSSLSNSSEKWRSSILYPWHPGRDEVNSFRKDQPLFIDYMAQYLPKEGADENSSEELNTVVNHLVQSSKENVAAYEKLRWVGDYLRMRLIGGREKTVHLSDESSISSKLETF